MPEPRPTPPDPVMEIWNLWASKLPAAKSMNAERKRKSAALRKVHTEDDIAAAARRLNESDFATGKNDRGWVATIDWFLKPESVLRTLEGKYDNRDRAGPQRRLTNSENNALALKELHEKNQRGEL